MHVGWNDLLSNSFNQVRSCFDYVSGLFKRLKDRSIRISADDLDIRVMLFQEPAGARDRAAGADARHKVCDLAFSLAPNFRAGGAIVRLRICGMGILDRKSVV